MTPIETMRLDKWLWCARFYKTRGLATEEIGKGRVTVNGLAAKPGREVRPGDTIALKQGVVARTVRLCALNAMRGPAPAARLLYEETAESVALREAAAEQRRLSPEPAASFHDGRPTKRNRRDLERTSLPGWGSRWTASIDD